MLNIQGVHKIVEQLVGGDFTSKNWSKKKYNMFSCKPSFSKKCVRKSARYPCLPRFASCYFEHWLCVQTDIAGIR